MDLHTRWGPFELDEHGLPSEASVAKLFEQFDFSRAIQAYLWALPIVAFA